MSGDGDGSGDRPTLPPELRCPRTGAALRLSEDGRWVLVEGHAHRYSVRDGLAVLVPGAAVEADTPAGGEGGSPSDPAG